MGLRCLMGYAEAFGWFADGVLVQLVVFEESLSLFTHGNTFPGHGQHRIQEERVTDVLRICVTYVPL
jgi:hypothetical protein